MQITLQDIQRTELIQHPRNTQNDMPSILAAEQVRRTTQSQGSAVRGVLRCLPAEQAQDCESVSARLPCAGLRARLSATRCRTGAAPCPAASRPASAADRRLPAQAPACAASPDAQCSAAPYAHCILPGNEASLMEEALARRRWWRPAEAAAVAAAVAAGRFELWWGGNAQRFPVTIFRGGASPAIGSDVGQAIQDTTVAWF